MFVVEMSDPEYREFHRGHLSAEMCLLFQGVEIGERWDMEVQPAAINVFPGKRVMRSVLTGSVHGPSRM